MVMASTGRDMLGCFKLQQKNPGINNFVNLKLNAMKVAYRFEDQVAVGKHERRVNVENRKEVHIKITRCFSSGMMSSGLG